MSGEGTEQLVWSGNGSLSELSLSHDWDYYASSFASLKKYLFEYGTVPTWDFHFCGGRPELGNPQSWGYTWPSVFAYVLPDYHAIMALWLVMTVVGWISMQRLLLRWTKSPLGSWTGATLFVANGFFASRFNLGHMTYCFFHFIPLLILLFEKHQEHQETPQDTAVFGARWLALITLTSFGLFTAGLPHTLFYPYVAFAVFVPLATFVRRRENPEALKRSLFFIGAHVLGLLLAMYKLWPVISWQMMAPRYGTERVDISTPIQLASNLLRFIPDYKVTVMSGAWANWEYNDFVGPLALLFAAMGLYGQLANRESHKTDGQSWRQMYPVGFAVLMIGLGFWLATGNGHPASPFYWFRNLPLLGGIRVFARYQILVLLGVSVLAAFGVASLQNRLLGHRLLGHRLLGQWKRVWIVLLPLTIGPPLAETLSLLWQIPVVSDGELREVYKNELPAAQATFINPVQPLTSSAIETQSFLVRAGYFIGYCYEPLSIRRPEDSWKRDQLRLFGLTTPKPDRIKDLTANSLTLEYSKFPEGSSGDIRINLPLYQGLSTVVAPGGATVDGSIVRNVKFPASITVAMKQPAVEQGAWISLSTLFGIFLGGAGVLIRRVSKRDGRRGGEST